MMSFDFDFAGPSDWAYAYRRVGLNVVPAVVATEKKKHPVAGWREYQHQLVPEFLFDRWYKVGGEQIRNYSMGFITGPGSLKDGEALLLIDIDVKNGALGPQTWQAWLDEHENGIEPETWRARTGSGGRHLYFRYPAHLKIYNTQEAFNGIDVRAEGGFVMAAPSPHYIPGTIYRWEDIGPLEENDTLADAPEWLIAICMHIGEREKDDKGTDLPRKPRAEVVAAVEEINAFGKRTNGREAYMTRVVWGAVLDLRREAPIKPQGDATMQAMLRAYEVYVAHVKTRLPTTNEEGLEREGRGLSLFQEKWDRAMDQWDAKVSHEAAKDRPGRPFDAGPGEDPPQPTAAPQQRPRIELIPWDDLPEIAVTWQIKDFIPQGGLVALYGKPGSYKSFVALYLAACIGSVMDAFGRPTNHGDVVYIAGEGGAGLKKRRDAFMRHYNLPAGTRVHFIRAQLDLRSTAEDAKGVVGAIETLGIVPTMVIIDTLARAFAGGNENASEDMGAFIRQVTGMQEALGGPTVLLVHHSGKDEARGMRGHSALLGAVDTELEVVKLSEDNSPTRTGKMTVTKQKDGEDGYDLTYRLELVSLSSFGADMDTGNASLVVVPDDAVDPSAKPKKPNLTDNDRVALAALELAAEDTDRHPGLEAIPRDVVPARTELWRRTFYQMSAHEPETRRKVFGRAQERLTASGTVKVWGEWSWISRAWK